MSSPTSSFLTADEAANVFEEVISLYGDVGARIIAEALNAGFAIDAKLKALDLGAVMNRADLDSRIAGVRDALLKASAPAEFHSADEPPMASAPKAKGDRNAH